MKLIVQIPCLNEAATLPVTLAELPRAIPGIDCIEVLIVDDGSTDLTRSVAREAGVHHIVRHRFRRGLAAAFMTGLDASLSLNADIIVTTDADNQYVGSDISCLVAPILEGRAELVVGDRQVRNIKEFSTLKRLLQWVGSACIRGVSQTSVRDSPSGFRAYTRAAAASLFVHNRFTYTLETVIQAGQSGVLVESVPIRVNPSLRHSRLFRSTPEYLRRAAAVILRAVAMYRPLGLIKAAAIFLLVPGLALSARFLYHYVTNPSYSGYVQSLVLGTTAIVLGFLLGTSALLAELLATNRRLLEDIRMRLGALERDSGLGGTSRLDIEHTSALPWMGEASGVPAP